MLPPEPTDNENQTNSGPNVISELWDYVSRQPTMSQKEVVQFFGELDILVDRAFSIVGQSSDFGFWYILDVLGSTAASLTHNKTIYSKSILRPNTKRIKAKRKDKYIDPLEVYYTEHTIAFLEKGFEFAHHLSLAKKSRDISAMEHSFVGLCLTRAILQEVIDLFMEKTRDYIALSHMAVDYHNRNLSGEYSEEDSQTFINILRKLHSIEQVVGISGDRLYTVCRSLSNLASTQKDLVSRIVAPFLRIVSKESISRAKSENQVLENFQYGSIGLLQAILSYDQSVGAVFSTYSRFWIIQSILYHIKKTSNFFKLPNSIWQTRTIIERARKKIVAEKGTCSIDDIVAETELSKKKVEKVYDYVNSARLLSLDYTVDDRSTLGETLPDDSNFLDSGESIIPAEILDKLDERQRRVISLRYGLFDLLPGEQVADTEVQQEKERQDLRPNKNDSVNRE